MDLLTEKLVKILHFWHKFKILLQSRSKFYTFGPDLNFYYNFGLNFTFLAHFKILLQNVSFKNLHFTNFIQERFIRGALVPISSPWLCFSWFLWVLLEGLTYNPLLDLVALYICNQVPIWGVVGGRIGKPTGISVPSIAYPSIAVVFPKSIFAPVEIAVQENAEIAVQGF